MTTQSAPPPTSAAPPTRERISRRSLASRELGYTGFYLGRAYHAFAGCLADAAAEMGVADLLKRGRGMLLYPLFARGELRLGELAAATGVPLEQLHRTTAELVDDGLVECEPDPDPERSMVRLTAHGRALESMCRRLHAAANHRLASRLTAAESDQLRRLLARAIGGLR